MLEQLASIDKKMNLNLTSHHIHNFFLKWAIDLNRNCKTFRRKCRRKSLEHRTRKRIFRHGIKGILC